MYAYTHVCIDTYIYIYMYKKVERPTDTFPRGKHLYVAYEK